MNSGDLTPVSPASARLKNYSFFDGCSSVAVVVASLVSAVSSILSMDELADRVSCSGGTGFG